MKIFKKTKIVDLFPKKYTVFSFVKQAPVGVSAAEHHHSLCNGLLDWILVNIPITQNYKYINI